MSFPLRKNKIFVFDHIPKCAGSTLHAIFKKVDPTYQLINTTKDLLEFTEKINRGPAGQNYFVGGHGVFGLHELVDKDFAVEYFTLLRDPVATAYSFYKYYRKIGSLNYGSFVDYIYDNPFNCITSFLGGTIERATVRLESYTFVGFVEDFGNSLAVLEKIVGHALQGIPRKNVTPSGFDPLTSLNLDDMKEYSPDFILYASFKKHDAAVQQVFQTTGPTREESDPGTAPGSLAQACAPIERWRSGDIDAQGLVKTIKAETDAATIEYSAKLLAKTNHAIDDETLGKLIDALSYGIPEHISPARIDTKERFDAIYRLYLELSFSTMKESVVFKAANALLEFLSNSDYAAKNNLSIALLQQALRRSPFSSTLWQNLGLKFRAQGEFDHAREALDLIPAANRWTTYCNELLVLHHAQFRDAYSFETFLDGCDPEPHSIAMNFLSKNFPFSGRTRLAEMARKKVLLFRSGPMALFDKALHALDENHNETTLILQRNLACLAKYAKYKQHCMDNGWFCPSANTSLRENILSNPPDIILMLCSDFRSLNRLENFIEFSTRLCRDMYAFPISNLYCPLESYSLIPLT